MHVSTTSPLQGSFRGSGIKPSMGYKAHIRARQVDQLSRPGHDHTEHLNTALARLTHHCPCEAHARIELGRTSWYSEALANRHGITRGKQSSPVLVMKRVPIGDPALSASNYFQPLPTVANQHLRRMVFGLGCQVRRALLARSAKNRQFQ